MAEFVQSEMKVIEPNGVVFKTSEILEKYWDKLGDIPVDDDGIIQETFLWWPEGTDREDIWHWLDERYPGGVVKLMGLEDKNASEDL